MTKSASAFRHLVRSGHEFARCADALSTLMRRETIAPSSSLNIPIGRGRRLVCVRQPLGELQRITERFGVTINDLLLMAVADGVHDLLHARGESTEGRSVQVLVPVGTDHHGDHHLGNQVGAMMIRLPIKSSDPVDRLRSVARLQASCKRHHQVLASALLLGLLEPWPQPLLAAAARLIHRQPFFNLVVTNVPGPGVPLYVLGARMLEAFPIVPIAGNLSIGIAALSYDGQLTVGLLVDPEACPDSDVLADGISRSFVGLIAAIEILDIGPGTGTSLQSPSVGSAARSSS